MLEGRAPELALHYPSVGGTAPVRELWPAAERTCRQHLDALRVLVRRPALGRVAVPRPQRAAQVDDLLERAGRRWSPLAPLLRAGMEPERIGPEEWTFRVRARLWPGGRELSLADCHGHGPPVHWTGAGLAT